MVLMEWYRRAGRHGTGSWKSWLPICALTIPGQENMPGLITSLDLSHLTVNKEVGINDP